MQVWNHGADIWLRTFGVNNATYSESQYSQSTHVLSSFARNWEPLGKACKFEGLLPWQPISRTSGFILTCCFKTRFFTPSITNCEPVFITLEKRLRNKRGHFKSLHPQQVHYQQNDSFFENETWCSLIPHWFHSTLAVIGWRGSHLCESSGKLTVLVEKPLLLLFSV